MLTGIRLNDSEARNMSIVSQLLKEVRTLDSFEPIHQWLIALRIPTVTVSYSRSFPFYRFFNTYTSVLCYTETAPRDATEFNV